MHRRAFLASALAPGAAPHARPRLTLGHSTYGLPGWPAEKALALIARLGFDSAELCLLPAYDSAPEKMTRPRRAALRSIVADTGLSLTALMENVAPSADNKVDAASRSRLSRALDLGRDLVPRRPPLVETVLGGGTWDKVKSLYRDRLGRWLEVFAEARCILAIKPHRFGAMSLPEHAAWLIGQLKSPWLRLAFDLSHYEHRGLDLLAEARAAAPLTAFVAIKDVVVREGKASFLLPGQSGKMDHAGVLKALAVNGYRGDVNCEVSGMISGAKGFDGEAAARACFWAVSRILAGAGLR
jgi:inosose dehydratase